MKHMFSDVKAFRHDPIGLFARVSGADAPSLVRLNLGPSPVYLVNDAPLAKEILKADDSVIDKGRLVHKLRSVIGISSITMSGPEHLQRRAAIHQHLARGIMNAFVPQITALIRRHAALLSLEDTFDAHEVTAPLALRVIVSLLFGSGALSSGDEAALMEAVGIAEDEMADRLFRILPRAPWDSFKKRRRARMSREVMGQIVDRVQKNAVSDSLIKSLQSLKLSSTEIRDEVLLLLLAGHHTTGNSAAWVLYFMATQPNLSEKIAYEATAIMDSSGEIDPLKLQKADLSARLAREVLRLYPPFYWLSREFKTPTELAGRRLKRGTSLIISSWQIQRDDRYWSEPHEFRLDRNYNTPAFLPFGFGARACVGIGLGLLELQLLALEIASACEVEILSEVPAGAPSPLVTLLPPKIRLRLKPRQAIHTSQRAELRRATG